MRVDKILFATDFSPPSYAALDIAVTLARARNATLIVAHCRATILPLGGDEIKIPSDVDADLDAMLNEALGGMQGINVEKRFLWGDTAQKIVELAEKENVDLVVLGTHGRSGLKRVLMGSVAETIVRNTPCPVLMIRQRLS
jgi:nucleotide-binding universal stress UspA family protein